MPRRAHYIGPLVWDGPPGEVRVSFPDRDRPLVYATLGNTGDPSVADLVSAAFADDNRYQVLLTGRGGRSSAPNVRVVGFVPGSVAMAEAVAVVHCGGNGSTYQALAAGHPAVAIPSHTDQLINGYLLRSQNAGLPLILAGLRPEQVRAAVDVVLRDKGMRAAAVRFEGLLSTTDGPTMAADLVIG